MPKLLLVDDDDALRAIMAALLRKTGHEVVEASNAATTFRLTAEQPFDLLIIDVMMPDLDGYELTRRLRGLERTRTTPILIVTASLRGPEPDLALQAGADDYDMKTANAGRLNRKIAEVLAARKAALAPSPLPEGKDR